VDYFFPFVLAILLLFIDYKALKNGSKLEKGIYCSILGIFIAICLLKLLGIEIGFPFQWILDNLSIIKRFYQFLEVEG